MDKSTVLIVDDQVIIQQTLKHLLAEEGYHLAFANNGTQALELAAQLIPDVILLDVIMPDIDGFEVCRRLRASSLLADVPILLLTALQDRQSRLRGLEAGADDFISKPFDGLELLTKLRTTTRLNRYRRLLEERSRREQAEGALQESQERYRLISELTSDYAYLFRVEPDGSWVPEWMSEAFIRITGFMPEEAISCGAWAGLIHPQDLPLAQEQCRRLGSGETTISEYRILTRNGEIRWLRNYGRPVWDAAQSRVVKILGAAQDITARKQAEEEVARHRRDLRRLSAQLFSAQEAERARLARELHDELGQALTAISLDLAEALKSLPPDSPPRFIDKLTTARMVANEALDQVRRLSLDLRPGILDDLGLVSALRWYLNRWNKSYEIQVEFQVMGLEERLPPELETALYRIVQEAMTNVAKHAQASQVRVLLERTPSTTLALIEDNGRGFVPDEVFRETPIQGAGLLGIRERASLLGGQFTITSHPGQGTCLLVEVPLPDGGHE
ncbi:MAG: response regulator [Anaerolineae bacterium]